MVTVYFDKEKIEVNTATMKININEEEIQLKDVYQLRDAEKTIVAHIRVTRDGFFEIDSPTHWIRVTCNTEEVIVLGSPVHRGKLCGLCGSQSGEKKEDLTGPKKCNLPSDVMDVAYELRQPSGCTSANLPQDREVLQHVRDTCLEERFFLDILFILLVILISHYPSIILYHYSVVESYKWGS